MRVHYIVVDGDDWYAPGDMVTAPKGYWCPVRASVPKVSGALEYYTFTDGLTEIAPAYWTATVRARDQHGSDVAGAEVRVSSIVVGDDDWYSPGEQVTAPKGCRVTIVGKVANAAGPGTNWTFTDGQTEIDPGFWEFSVACRDQNGTVV